MNIQSGLSPGQVLQRNLNGTATVLLKGACAKTSSLSVSILAQSGALPGWDRREVGRAANGKFSLKLQGIPAGGPYKLSLHCGKQQLRVHPFFVGDVWILAGQSNMSGSGTLNLGAQKLSHKKIRAFSLRREWRLAAEPLHIGGESPDRCHHNDCPLSPEDAEIARQTAVKGAGVGLHFALEMEKRSGVPQGLICAARGDTSLEQWSPDRQHLGGDSYYASMLASVRATGQKVAGLLWYQGENETSETGASKFTSRMETLVASCRKDLQQPGLPWAAVQLGRVISYRSDAESWNSVQEQQRLLPERIANFEVVPAIDLALDDGIHIAGSAMPQLALRLARVMDRLVNGNRRELPPPRLEWIRRHYSNGETPGPKCAVDIGFANISEELKSAIEPAGFSLFDAENQPLSTLYKTSLHGRTVRLHLTAPPPDGTTISHGAGMNPVCSVTDARDFCLPVFIRQPIEKEGALLPFVTRWKTTPVLPSELPLAEVPFPPREQFGNRFKNYNANGFVDEHAAWIGQRGIAYFQSTLQLKRPSTLKFLMGYDGPFRLWLNGESFFVNPFGMNSCIPDESARIATLPAGAHEITVGMDVSLGRSWGFFLRFRKA